MDFDVFVEAEDGIGVDETGTGDWNFNLSSNEEAVDYMDKLRGHSVKQVQRIYDAFLSGSRTNAFARSFDF